MFADVLCCNLFLLISVTKDSNAEEYGYSGETTLVLLVLYNWCYNVPGLDTGQTTPRYVYYRSQVGKHTNLSFDQFMQVLFTIN